MGLKFTPSPKPTLGVEVELALVDGRTMALSSAAPRLLGRLPDPLRGWSAERSKYLGESCLDALHAVLPDLKA